jgi:hypothetical protein
MLGLFGAPRGHSSRTYPGRYIHFCHFLSKNCGLIQRQVTAEFLFFRLAGFVGEYAFLGAGAAFALLAAGFFNARTLGGDAFAAGGFDFIQQ